MCGSDGGLLYNTASLEHLRKGLPDCHWTYACEPPAAEVLRGNPCIEEVVRRADLPPLPRGAFDVALCYNSGAFWRDLLLAARLAIPNRVGYTDKGFSALVTFPIELTFPQPYPAYFRGLVAQLTNQVPDWPLRPLIYPGPEKEDAAAKLWTD